MNNRRGRPLRFLIAQLVFISGCLFLPTENVRATARHGGASDMIDEATFPTSRESTISLFRATAESSQVVTWQENGHSHEGQPLGFAIISAPENLRRLDELQSGLSRLADPRLRTSSGDVSELLDSLPAVVWLSCSVHGNELSPTDAACRLLEMLIDEKSATAREIRDSLIVLLDPLRNPDGRSRSLADRRRWSSFHRVDDDQSLHHRELWPGGRGNHYFIDLNRDSWQLTQPETRRRAEVIAAWQPQVVVDMHEMRADDTFLFSPPNQPLPSFLPPTLGKWWDRFARAMGRAMTDRGHDYYRGDWHETFAPDRFVAWSIRTGAVAILLEVPGVDGSHVRKRDGTLLTFDETIARHLSAAEAILTTAARNRRALLSDFHTHRRHVVDGTHLEPEEGRLPLRGNVEDHVDWLLPGFPETLVTEGTSPEGSKAPTNEYVSLTDGNVRTVVLPPSRNDSRRRLVVETLLRQGIEVGLVDDASKVGALSDPQGRTPEDRRVAAGSYVIDLHQPLGSLAASLLNVTPTLDEEALLAERKSLEQTNRSLFYSVTAWSLPLWADIDVLYASDDVAADPMTHESLNASARRQINPATLRDAHSLMMDAADDATLVAALRLLEDGVPLQASAREIMHAGRTFSPGSIIVPLHGDAPLEDIARVCGDAGANLLPIDLALTDRGPDLGSRHVSPLVRPRVAILSGFGTSAQALGRMWHVFDDEMQWPVTLLSIQRISRADLGAYNAIVLPDGPREGGARLREIIGSANWNRLLDWVSFGGTLIVCGESIAAFPNDPIEESRVHLRVRREILSRIPSIGRRVAHDLAARALLDRNPTLPKHPFGDGPGPLWVLPEFADEMEALAWDERERRFSPRGVLMRMSADPYHWLAAGLGAEPAIPVWTAQVCHALPPAQAVARLATGENLCVAGLLWPEARRRWEASTAIGRERIGSGQVIAIAGDFKRGSPVLERLVLNAALLGPSLGARPSTGY